MAKVTFLPLGKTVEFDLEFAPLQGARQAQVFPRRRAPFRDSLGARLRRQLRLYHLPTLWREKEPNA